MVYVEPQPTFQIKSLSGSAELAVETARLIGTLPAWFGRPDSNAEYVDSARRLPGLIASNGDEALGVLLYHRHYLESAEIHLIAVAPEWHRRGVGKALCSSAEATLKATGCRLVQVKTLGPTDPDPGYAATREFYRANGFLRLEETHELWPDTPCLILVKSL